MSTETVDVREAQSRLPELLSLSTAGTEVVIADRGTPRVRLVPVGPDPSAAKERVAGLDRGSVTWIDDEFDAPLPDDFWLGACPAEGQRRSPSRTMKTLLDTHAFIWWFDAPHRLSARALALCQDPRNALILSVVSLREIVIKSQIGRLRLNQPLAQIVARQQQQNGLVVLPVELAHVLAVEHVPLLHRDPFDRLLIAQATAESLPLLSGDAVFNQYPIAVYW
jgi:PIN domain nuclease of toxin-antitoxin system/antitoxin (DNA-binding transcriptional repressor) of toxin-antitoxin stability system